MATRRRTPSSCTSRSVTGSGMGVTETGGGRIVGVARGPRGAIGGITAGVESAVTDGAEEIAAEGAMDLQCCTVFPEPDEEVVDKIGGEVWGVDEVVGEVGEGGGVGVDDGF